jgi:hypothetical protein
VPERSPEPERIKGPPFVLPGREPRAVERRPPVRAQQPAHIADRTVPTEELSELDRDVAAAARQFPEAVGGDDLALASEVAAAVDTETDEDAEWAQLARGPEAFPEEHSPDAPGEGEESPEPQTD